MRHWHTGRNKKPGISKEAGLIALAVTGPFRAGAPLTSAPACPGFSGYDVLSLQVQGAFPTLYEP